MVLESNDSEMPDIRTPAQKRQETMSRKKLQDLAELRELEAKTKVPRKARVKALEDPAWKKKKRAYSLTATLESNHTTKKKKVTPESSKKGNKKTTTKLPGRKKTRCEPAVIQVSDKESSDEQDRDHCDPAPKRKAVTKSKSRAVVISDDEAEDEAIDDDNQEEDSDESSEFEKLDTKALKEKMWRKRAQWAAQSEPEEEDNNNNVPKLDLELTTASEADLLPNDNNSSGEELRLPSASRKKPSKRDLDRGREVPQWKQSDDDNSDIEPSTDEQVIMDSNKGWHRAVYIPPQPGRLISIMAQPVNLQIIIRAAIRRVMGDIIFENTYVASDKVIAYNQKTLSTVAKELEKEQYAIRFAKDHTFAVVVGRVLGGRVSTFRGHLKKIALSKVEGFYQLIGPECKAKVEQFIKQTGYIFPRKDNGTLIKRTKPFHHLAIVSTLRQVLEEGGLGEKHNTRFISSITEEPRSNELEMPAALVAAVATAIHSALDDYSTGSCIKTEFNADVYEDVYRAHITTLTNVQKTNPDGYHRLMADLYNMTLSGGPLRSGLIANNAMELIEFGEMDI